MFVTIHLPAHSPANDPRADAPDCEPSHEVAIGLEPDDPHYGADADGRRGVFRAGYHYVDDELPRTCAVCGYVFTDAEQHEMLAAADAAATRALHDAHDDRAERAYNERVAFGS